MSKAVLSQVIDIGVEGQTGSFNLSDTHLDIFISNLSLITMHIADVFNRDLIPKLIDWNFGTGLYPEIKFQPFDREDRKLLADIFTRISGARQINISPELKLALEEHVADALGLDIDFDKIRERDMARSEEMLNLEVEKTKSEIDVLNKQASETATDSNSNNGGNGVQ